MNRRILVQLVKDHLESKGWELVTRTEATSRHAPGTFVFVVVPYPTDAGSVAVQIDSYRHSSWSRFVPKGFKEAMAELGQTLGASGKWDEGSFIFTVKK